MRDRSRGVIIPIIVAGVILLVLKSCGVVAAAQSPTGGTHAPGTPNVLMHYGQNFSPKTKPGSRTYVYNGKDRMVRCRKCGRIVRSVVGGYTVFKLKLKRDQQIVAAYDGYRATKKGNDPRYLGRYFGDTNWDGVTPLGKIAYETVADGNSTVTIRTKIDFIEVQIFDPHRPQTPDPQCQGECPDTMAGPGTK